MSMASNWLEEQILNHFIRNAPVPSPQSVYLALFINDPTDANTGTEVQGGSYSRQQVTFSQPIQSSDKAVIMNNHKIEYPVATAEWGSISHWGLMTAPTGGNLICRGVFNRLETVQTGNRFVLEPNNLQVSME